MCHLIAIVTSYDAWHSEAPHTRHGQTIQRPCNVALVVPLTLFSAHHLCFSVSLIMMSAPRHIPALVSGESRSYVETYVHGIKWMADAY